MNMNTNDLKCDLCKDEAAIGFYCGDNEYNVWVCGTCRNDDYWINQFGAIHTAFYLNVKDEVNN